MDSDVIEWGQVALFILTQVMREVYKRVLLGHLVRCIHRGEVLIGVTRIIPDALVDILC